MSLMNYSNGMKIYKGGGNSSGGTFIMFNNLI